jgi:aminoglycoside phosphotransferase (APT) family kinase protein
MTDITMTRQKLHADEVDISIDLVRQLIREQFPQWAVLPLKLILPEGTDNVMYQLGANKVVRLPRTERAARSLEIERIWLPKLAPSLPIPIPILQGVGSPSPDYPFTWLVCSRLDGETPVKEEMPDLVQAARDMGNFVKDLQKIDPTGAPLCNRGRPLTLRDEETRRAIKALENIYDLQVLTTLWNQVLEVPSWSGNPVWIHGDLHPGNLLVQNKRISGVVDFGLAGVWAIQPVT